ncbi:MAG: lipase [Acidimicrobiales bacterium]|nr:MAG: lipase [Acidimicrobiales bacterium]
MRGGPTVSGNVRRTRGRFAVPLLVALVALAACAPLPPDDFYTPPDPLPSGSPGDVIRWRESDFAVDPVLGVTPPGVRSYQVLYRSTDSLGQAVAVSGTVLVPGTPWLGLGDRPIVGYAVGTRGLGDSCAPSRTLAEGTDYEGAFVASLLTAGYAVAVTDYEGLGTPGQHTYMVGASQGHAVLDAVRAAQRLEPAGLSPRAPVALVGYSQGGSGAGWAAQLAASYAPELRVRAAAIGGVPADLTRVAEFLDGGPFVGFALMAALGMDAEYPELRLDDFLNDRGRELKREAESVCLVSVDGFSTFLQTAFSRLEDYTVSDPLETPQWKARLAQQKLGAQAPRFPVYQYHGAIDEIIPLDQARALRDSWCRAGASVTFETIPLAEHLLGMVEGFPKALGWLSARLAGIPAATGCS